MQIDWAAGTSVRAISLMEIARVPWIYMKSHSQETFFRPTHGSGTIAYVGGTSPKIAAVHQSLTHNNLHKVNW